MRKSKLKINRGKEVGPFDNCSTPPYAPRMLYPFIPNDLVIWEACPGEGYLIQALMTDGGYRVIWPKLDSLIEEPDVYYSVIVTNTPFSNKLEWLIRFYELEKPFALLFPWEFAAQFEIKPYINDLQFLIPNTRINYKMPIKGWDSNAQFPTAWFCRGLNLPERFNYVDIKQDRDIFIRSYRKGQFLYTTNITEAFEKGAN